MHGWPANPHADLASLAVDPGGNAVVTGRYEDADGGSGFFLVKLGP